MASPIEPLSPSPQAFTFFSRLPTEIRLKIWQDAFPPGRKINIALPSRSKNSDSLPGCPLPPVTLYVNHESREETLKHYCVIFPQDIHFHHERDREAMLKGRPLWLNADRDFFYFPLVNPSRYGGDAFIGMWLPLLNSTIPGNLRAVKHLEFTMVSTAALQSNAYYIYIGEGPKRSYIALLAQHFTGLDLLTVTMNHGYGLNIPMSQDIFNEVVEGDSGAEFLGFSENPPKMIRFKHEELSHTAMMEEILGKL